jgi:hypothetical protein
LTINLLQLLMILPKRNRYATTWRSWNRRFSKGTKTIPQQICYWYRSCNNLLANKGYLNIGLLVIAKAVW